MSFQPLIPLSGIPGWRILERTQPIQQKAFDNDPQIKRDVEYFKTNIGKVKSAADLVADRRLLNVALGAFGLEGEIDKKAFVRKILEGGTDDLNSLANRLTGSGIKEFAQTFGFGNAAGSQIGKPGFAEKMVANYKTRAFETAVGNSNNDIRLAMNFKREITELSNASLRRAYEEAPQVKTEVAYFAANIGKALTADALVADRRLLTIALGAFGLGGEIDKTDYLRAVLKGGTEMAGSLANVSTTPGIKEFVAAFGYGDKAGAQTNKPDFAVKIGADYKNRSFETLLADAKKFIPQALDFKRELAALSKSDATSWYRVIGSKPLRSVFETALNLPKELVKLDVDRQRLAVMEGARKLTGSDKITAFDDPRNMEKLINRFLVMSQIRESAASSSSANTALTLLQNMRSNGQGLSNLFASRT